MSAIAITPIGQTSKRQLSSELRVREHESGGGQRFETMRRPQNAGPAQYMPVDLLDRVRQEAERRGNPYQRSVTVEVRRAS